MSKKDKKKPSKRSTTQQKKTKEEENLLLQDDRFKKATTHPQFSNIPFQQSNKKNASSKNNKQKTVIDERFSKLLTDENFQSISTTTSKGSTRVDKYGKKIDKKKMDLEELSSFYTLEGKEEEEKEQLDEEEDESEEDEKRVEGEALDMENPEVRIAYLTALSRGEIDDSSSEEENADDDESSSSSSDDSSSGEEDFEAVGNEVLNPLVNNDDEDTANGGELIFEHASRHMAILNLDWSNMHAMDVLVLLSSFAKTPGDVRSVCIYPSNFGLEQIQKDDTYGPSGIWKKKQPQEENNNNGDDKVDDIAFEEDDIDPVKLRAYEASKLRYYFAVAEFSSSEALDHVHDELNGEEFEHSSIAIELRLIPTKEDLNGIIINRGVKEKASLPIPSTYNPPDFILDALQYTKVKCTWDEDDVQRRHKLTTAPTLTDDQDYDDLRVYLASDNSSDDDEQSVSSSENIPNTSSSLSTATKARKLLGLADDDEDSYQEDEEEENSGDINNNPPLKKHVDKEEAGNKQFTYNPEKKQLLEQKIQDKANAAVQKEEDEQLTSWDKYLLKRKLKRKERREASKAKRYQTDSDEEEQGEEKTTTEITDPTHQTTKEELELLLAGDDKEEQNKDFNMRQLIKLQTTKKKSSAKKQALLEETSGQEFQINVQDTRFQALMDGMDSRFGIDKSNPNYKSTDSMKRILNEQGTRRRKHRRKLEED